MTSQKYTPQFSCEFFPPKTDKGFENLLKHSQTLQQTIDPAYFSVTYGAGGSDQAKTFSAVEQINAATGVSVAPHLTCIGSKKNQIADLLTQYKNQGINRLVALRGDLPEGMENPGELNFANELISFIRETNGDHFEIEVAAYPEMHPQAISLNEDLKNFKQKVDAGANNAITQYFFNSDAYFRFIDDCEKRQINIPVIAGIMPITNYTGLKRFSAMCGAEIPRWIEKRLEGFGDDMESIKDFGTDVISEMTQKLLNAGVPGVHFYTLNQADATLRIWNNLSK